MSEELVLRLRPTGKDPVDRDDIHDVIRDVAMLHGWNVVDDRGKVKK